MSNLVGRVHALEARANAADSILHVRSTSAIDARLRELRDEAIASGEPWPEPDEESRARLGALLAASRRTIWVSERDEKL